MAEATPDLLSASQHILSTKEYRKGYGAAMPIKFGDYLELPSGLFLPRMDSEEPHVNTELSDCLLMCKSWA